jgi:hypothetical protein
MKRIALVTVCLAAAVGAGVRAYPAEVKRYAAAANTAALRAWENVEGNPVPVGFALGTFLLTVVYHKAKGKSLRESVEVAATRVTVVPLPAQAAGEADDPVVKRAKARTTWTQLLADQIALENLHRKLPDEVLKAEKEACYTEQAVADAGRVLANKQQAHDEAVAKLDAVRKRKAAADAELGEIAVSLKKLADQV